MALFWRNKKIKSKIHILQITLYNCTPIQNLNCILHGISKKRASSPVFSGRKGSLAVEASLVLPLFLFFILNIISILQLLSCYSRIEAALHQTARKWALYAHAEDGEIGAESAIGIALLPREIEKQIGADYLARSPVKGGRQGLQCYLSQLPDEDEVMDLVVCYQVTPVFSLLGFSEFTMVNRCRVRAWTGYDVLQGGTEGESGEEIVYITENGVVYHKSRECTHLKLSINRVLGDALNDLRRADGGKYQPCEKCGDQGEKLFYYVAEQGDKYHTSLGCSGLRRKIMAVPLSQTGGMGACSRCY